ncbi:MAG: flavin reductase family protein [Burkholderiales bacterium]|nr:flavin reductase family protein [Burkholderiales bacterium]
MTLTGGPMQSAAASAPPPHPKPELRRAFGRFATGVAAITLLDEHGAPYGLTINSFASVSLEPPIISWNVICGSTAQSMIERAGRFVVNVLAEAQRDVALRLARPGADRFAGIAYSSSADGLPLIDGALACFECSLLSLLRTGDHDIVLARVERFEHHDGAPLLYWQGAYAKASGYDP